MARNVFISFLGTGRYKPCVYKSHDGEKSKVVEYVQEAILDLYCREYREGDKAFFFLTQQAEKQHWDKLEGVLGKREFQIVPVKNLPDGHTEKEIWDIFELVYSHLEEEDRVILDVTHGFRSLPMLQIVLLNYARSLKNITVEHILYGAFESLGIPLFKIDEEIPDPADREVPILNLTSFSAIQSWAFGAESFVQTGSTETITKLSYDNINPILRESRGSDQTASNLRDLMKSLEQIEISIKTNRGYEIVEGSWLRKVRNTLGFLLEEDQQVFTPLQPILRKIGDKFSNFHTMSNWEASVQWCIDHGLVQQGITQLQEGIISHIVIQSGLEMRDLKHREIVSQSMNIIARKLPESKWYPLASDNKDLVRRIMKSDFVIQFGGSYQSLSHLRNDINHGGFRQDALTDGNVFVQRLSKIFEEFKSIRKTS